MSTANEPKALSPKDLAEQLFNGVLPQVKGDFHAAARQVIAFLQESLVYAVVSTTRDEKTRRMVLQSLGQEFIMIASPPAPGAPAAPGSPGAPPAPKAP